MEQLESERQELREADEEKREGDELSDPAMMDEKVDESKATDGMIVCDTDVEEVRMMKVED